MWGVGTQMIGELQMNFIPFLGSTIISKLFFKWENFSFKMYLNYLILENDTSIFITVFKNMILVEFARTILADAFHFFPHT